MAKIKLIANTESYSIYNGSMLDMLEVIEPNTIDSIITDPPYELNFMNKGWDRSGIAFQKETWEKCYEVLKPGGYLLAFGGSRTHHRIACAIEDAGFEIRDTIMWLYGSGFPKSLNIGLAIDKKLGLKSKIIGKGKSGNENTHTRSLNMVKNPFGGEYEIKQAQNQWQGWGTALKPAYEPIIVARKPFKGTVADNVIKYGVGGINIDECRIDYNGEIPNIGGRAKHTRGDGYGFKPLEENCVANTSGRFPANVIHDGSEEVESLFPYTKSGKMTSEHQRHTDGSPNGIYGKFDKEYPLSETYGDSGSASRFFYCAKASKKDRDEGLEIAASTINDGRKKPIDNPYQRGETPRKNIHPTVKPTELMQYLVRLVSPKGATILDPFMGSGSTGKAVMFENRERDANYKFIGIDLEKEYCEIAQARIDYALKLSIN